MRIGQHTPWFLRGLMLMGVCLFASPAQAQQLGGGQAADISLWRVFGALLFCLLLAAGAAFALRYRMTGRIDFFWTMPATTRRMVLVERLRLGAQTDLCLVSIDGVEWLATVTNAEVSLVPHTAQALPDSGAA